MHVVAVGKDEKAWELFLELQEQGVDCQAQNRREPKLQPCLDPTELTMEASPCQSSWKIMSEAWP